MGIRNRDGALFMATGIDNSGLYADRREAMGIIKAMASQVTSFDVFSGIGISAATAFASAAKSSYDFEKEFRKNMLEVATISTQVEGSMTDFMNQVMAITQEIPIKAPEAAKALYQIVSAGHDGAAGMKVLEVSAKSAVGGLTDTATAADAITTLINAYKMSADDAEKVSDQLFTTARLGKTTFGELGQSIAQVAPIAAAYGVEMDQVLAAVATLTKSGTPTAQAMTQIRASIIGTSKVLGDGAFDSMTFQEALAEIANRAGGSEAKLRELIPEVEAVNGVLGMTGIKARDAASDLNAMNESAGATEAAFKKMQEDVDNQMTLISNNIQAALRPMGDAILKNVSEAAQMINKGFETGQIQNSMEMLQKLLVAVAGAFVTYKSAAIGASTAEAFHSAKVTISNNLKSLQSQVIGEAIIAKEKERVHLDAYTASLERSITEEQRAKLTKLDLKAGSNEYMKALSEQALQEKKNADTQVETLTKVVNKNKEKLFSAQENIEMSHQAVEAAKAEFDAAFAANDLAGVEVAQTKMNVAAQREEAASTNVSIASKKLKSSETRLVTATTVAEAATTRVNTATTAADTAVTNIATTAKSRLKAATIALWGAMKANPIGAVLTLVSLAATTYMLFADKVKAAETAQSRLNKLNKAAAESIADEKAELMLLLSVAKNELVSKEDRTKAIKKLNDISPEYLNNLSLENLGTKEATQSIDAYTKAIEKNARMMAAQDMVADKFSEQLKIKADIEDLEKKKKINPNNKVVGDSFGGNKHVYAGVGKDIDYDNELKKKKKSYDDLQKEIDQIFSYAQEKIEKQPISIPVNIQIESEQANVTALLKKKEEIDARINKNKSNGMLVNAFDEALLATVNKELTDTNGRLLAIQKTASESTGVDVQSITKEVEAATTKVSTLKQELSDLRSGKTSVEAGKTVKEVIEGKVKDLKAAEDALSTLTGKDKGSIKEAADRLKTKQEQADLLLEISRNAKERENAERQTAFEIEQVKIDVMKDGFIKEQAQIELNHRKSLQGITQRGEEMLKAQQEAERKQWEKDGKKGVFTPKTTSVSQLPTDQLQQLTGLMNGVVAGTENQNQLLIDKLLKQYQGYADRRKEIEDKYNADIANLKKIGAPEASEDEAERKRKEESEALDMEFAQRNDEFNAWAAGIVDASVAKLTDLLSQANEALRNTKPEGENGVEQLAVLRAKIKTLEEQLKAQTIKETKDNSDPMLKWKKTTKALKDVKSATDDIVDSFSNLDEGTKAILTSVSVVAGSTVEAIGSLTSLVDNSGNAMSLSAFMAAKSISMVEKASVILTIISLAMKAAMAIASLFESSAERERERQEKLIQGQLALNEAIAAEAVARVKGKSNTTVFFDDYQNDIDVAIEGIVTSKGKYQDALDMLQNTTIKHSKSGWFSQGAIFWKKTWYEPFMKDYPNIINADGELNEAEAERILSVGNLSDAQKDLINTMLDSQKEMEEYETTINGVISDLSGSIGNDLKDAWVEAFRAQEDASAAARKALEGDMEAMIESMLFSITIQERLMALQESMKKHAKSGLSGAELTQAWFGDIASFFDSLPDAQKQFFDGLQMFQDEATKRGFDLWQKEEGDTDTSDNSLKGAYAKASQESITLLAGQTGAARVALEDIRNNMQPIREQMQFIRDLQTKGWEDVRVIRELTDKVEKNTGKIAEIAEKIDGSMSEIGKDTRRSADALDGGTINAKVKM